MRGERSTDKVGRLFSKIPEGFRAPLRSTSKMSTDPLDPILNELAQRTLPKAGDDFAADVWRAIEESRGWIPAAPTPSPDWWDEIFASLRPARLAFAGLSVATIIGAGVAVLAPRPDAPDPRLASTALGLDAFARSAPHLPSTAFPPP